MLNIEFKPRVFLNQFLLCLLAALMVFTPLYKYQKMIFILFLFVLWFLNALMLDGSYFNKSIPLMCFCIVVILLDILVGIFSNSSSNMLLGINKMPTFIWALIYLFYKDKIHLLNKPIKIILAMIAISAAFTLIGNLQYPGASRLLASSGLNDYYVADREFYRTINIGGYGFVFSLVFLSMPILLFWRKKKNVVLLIFLALLVSTVFVASYFIGIILMVAMIVFGFINPKHIWQFFILICLCILAVFAFSNIILEWLVEFGGNINSDILIQRATELLTGEYFNGLGDDNNRIQIYINAIINWSKRPLFGALQGHVDNLRRSGHSALLGYLETYGLFSIIYYVFYYNTYKNIKSSFGNSSLKNFFLIYYICFILFIFIDVFDTFCDLGLTVFFVAPVLFQLMDDNIGCSSVDNYDWRYS